MTPRAKHLAKVLLQRMAVLEENLLDAAPDEARAATMRQELVGKVLLSELGVTDFSLTNLVLVALPTVRAGTAPRERELNELAEFLDEHVDALRD